MTNRIVVQLSRQFMALVCVGARLPTQEPIPVRTLATPVAVSTDTLGRRVTVRPLSDGRVLVNDIQNVRLRLYDRTLTSSSTVLDSAALVNGATHTVPSVHLIPMPGDSTLYVDYASRSLLLFGPAGTLAHVTALPRPADAITLATGTSYGTPALDARGRLIYQGVLPRTQKDGAMMQLLEINATVDLPVASDSSPIVRADFDARTVDTLATIKIVQGERRVRLARDGRGNFIRTTVYNPMDVGDAWAVLPNGTLAILRGRDYHIDWIDPDGTRRSSPRMPFDWKRLSDEEKQRKVDSLKPILDLQTSSQRPGRVATETGFRQLTNVAEVLRPEELPDYEPAIAPGAMKADLDGNLWIVPRTALPGSDGGLRYDVVDLTGKLVERVRVPKGRAIAAFEPGGTIILTNTQNGVTTIERARLR